MHSRLTRRTRLARLVVPSALAIVAPAALAAQSPHADTSFAVPAWAFPALGRGPAPAATGTDTATSARVRTSRASFSVGRTRDRFDVADWNPETHAPPPAIVMHGRKPAVMACGFCHLADGRGRPENAMVAGLPAAYIVQQVKDMRSRARRSASPVPSAPALAMQAIADSVTDAELGEAAAYFSRVHARPASRVIETDSVPHVLALNGLYTLAAGAREPIGTRLVDVAMDLRRHELHDPMAEYVAYVPRGSVARGRVLALRGPANDGKGCTSCHGPQLRGTTLAPPIAGRAPSYLLRQLIAFRTGARAGPLSAPMHDVVGRLSVEDMISAAAYAGSRTP